MQVRLTILEGFEILTTGQLEWEGTIKQLFHLEQAINAQGLLRCHVELLEKPEEESPWKVGSTVRVKTTARGIPLPKGTIGTIQRAPYSTVESDAPDRVIVFHADYGPKVMLLEWLEPVELA